jgi:chromosome partitioning protein
MAGQRVLVVDVDPQGNATSGLGIDRSLAAMTLYDSLVEGAGIEPSIVATAIAGLSVVPSSVELAGADVELAAVDQRERRLRRVLEAVRNDYDYILLDCPPSLGLLTVNALTAADAVLIPLQSEYYALEGLTQLIATVNLVRDHLNPQLEIVGVVLTMYDARTNLSADVAGEARRHLGTAVFETVIPRNVRLSEAPSFGMPIALYRPDSRGAESYAALTDELLRRGRDSGARSASLASVAAATIRHEAAAAGMRP